MSPRKEWVAAGDAVRSWQFQTGTRAERLGVLAAAWEREMGHLSRHWRLRGVRRGIVYVAARSPAAAMELRLRTPGLVRELNKHFKTAWIKGIKTLTGA
jgi:hypothetical protein